ncbi:Ig-like domain-containing protein [Crocosphaera watsonii]|uniref:Tandem-95 repeat protein n=2 Tax=Crocosphaera watsonii TaxID=263511 RepID=G5J2N4_CROWT|nr:Ig-like domain-containing protein [Crocosphaera watsonii]EHJ13554.1 hypothetical protein CWATWH0003_1768 [Crocosphaera watsonii WH 0003]
MEIGGDITVSGGTLNVNQSITSNQLITSGGTLNINAEVNSEIINQSGGTTNINVIESFREGTISGGTFNSKEETTISDLDWTGGIISGRGKLTITDEFNLTNTTKGLTGIDIETQGVTNWDSGTIQIYTNQSQWTNTGTFNIIGARFIDNFNPVLIFDNQGTINKTDTGTATLEATVNNNGLINIDEGIFYITGNSNHTGDFTIAENARLQVTGNHNFENSSRINGYGDVTVVGGTTNLNGEVNIGGILRTNGGTLNINNNITVEQLVSAGGTVNVNYDQDFANLTISGGTFEAIEPLAVTDLVWQGGTLRDTDITASESLILNGTTKDINNSIIDNQGLATWTSGTIRTFTNGSWFNRQNAELDIAGDLFLDYRSGTVMVMENAGLLRKSAGTGTSTLEITLSNQGEISIESGTLYFTAGFAQSQGVTELDGGNLRVAGNFELQGGSIDGNGTIRGNLISAGTLNPGIDGAGLLVLNDGIIQTNNSRVNIEIGGLTAGAEFDRIEILGSAALNGVVNISLIDNFFPILGDSFDYLVEDGRGGTAIATATITITGENDNPLANDDTAATDENTQLQIPFLTLLANDSDIDAADNLTISQVNNAINGTVSIAGNTVIFNPETNFSGTTTFDYTIADGNGGSSTATVTVTVNPRVSWDNPSDGNWNDSGSWEAGIFPLPGDDVIISVPTDVTVTLAEGDVSVNSLTVAEDFRLTGGSLTIANDLTLGGQFTMDGGTLVDANVNFGPNGSLVFGSNNNVLEGVTVNGDLDLSTNTGANARFTNGSIFLADVNLGDGATLSMESSQVIDNVRIVYTGPGSVFGVGGSNQVILGNGAEILLRNSNTGIKSDLFVEGDGQVINQGTIIADGSIGDPDRFISSDIFLNLGLLQIANGGILNISRDWSNDGGTITVDENSGLVLNDQFNTVDIGTINNSVGGTVVLRNIIWDNTDKEYVFDRTTGDWNFEGGTISGGRLVFRDGAGLIFGNNNNVLDNVTVEGNLNLNSFDNARVRLTNGSVFLGNVNLGNNAVLSIETSQIINNTTIIIEGPGGVFGVSGNNNIILGPGAEIILANFDTAISSDLFVNGDGNFINQGTIVVDGSNGNPNRRIDTDIFSNEGILQIANGAILNFFGNWSNKEGDINIDRDSTLVLDGSFNTLDLGDIDNSVGGNVIIQNIFWDNSNRSYTFNNNTGSWRFDGGTVTGGELRFEDGAGLIVGNGNTVLDDVTIEGNLNLNSFDNARLNLTNGSVFLGNVNLGDGAILNIITNQIINNQVIRLDGAGSVFEVSGDNNVILGAGAQLILANSNASISSDVSVTGDGNLINQGTIIADGSNGDPQRTIDVDIFDNEGIIQIANGAILNLLGNWSNEEGDITIDSNSSLVISDSFNTLRLGNIDNSRGGNVSIQNYSWDNSNSSYTFNNSTGPWTFNGGTITGGTLIAEEGNFIVGTGNNVLDGVSVDGNLNLNTLDNARLTLTNGSTFIGNANLGDGAILNIATNQTINNSVIDLGGPGARFEVSGDNNVILGAGSQLILGNSDTSISSDVTVNGNDNFINQGTIIADGSNGNPNRSIDVAVFDNQGIIQVANGSILNILGNWSNTEGSIDIDKDSTLIVSNSFNTIDLGDIDNSAGGRFSLENFNWDNSNSSYTWNNSTGDWEFNGGTITGGNLIFSEGSGLVFGNGNNVLDDVDVDGNLNLNSLNGARLRLTNGSSFTGNANLGDNAILSIESDQTLNDSEINLSGSGATFGVSGDANLILGSNSRLVLGEANTSISSDVEVDGDGNVINQGTIVADGPGDRTIDVDVFNNEGVIQVANGSIVNVLGNWSNTGGTIDIDATSTLQLNNSFNTDDLGDIDNSVGGKVSLRNYNWDNSNSNYTFNNNTGSWEFNGGTVTGGSLTFEDDTQLVIGSGNNVLDDVDVDGNLNLNSVNGARLSLTNGSTFTGNANLGENAILSIDSDQTIDNTIIRLEQPGAKFGVSGDGNVIIGANSRVSLLNVNTSISSDIDVDGDGNIVNQGLIVADGPGDRSIDVDVFNNEGVIQVANGSILNVLGDWSNTGGTIDIDANSSVQLNNSFNTDDLGDIDNSVGGKVSLRNYNWDNSDRNYTFNSG